MAEKFIPIKMLYEYLDDLRVSYSKDSVKNYILHNTHNSLSTLIDEIVDYFNKTKFEDFIEGPLTRKFFDFSKDKKISLYLRGILEDKIKELYREEIKHDIVFALKSPYYMSHLKDWRGIDERDLLNYMKYSCGEYLYSDLYDIYTSMKRLSSAFRKPRSFIDIVKKRKPETKSANNIYNTPNNLVELINNIRSLNKFLEVGDLKLLYDIKSLGGDVSEFVKLYNKFKVPSSKKFIEYYTSAKSLYGDRFLEEFRRTSLYGLFNKKFGRYISVGVPVSAGFTSKTYLWGIFKKMREMKG